MFFMLEWSIHDLKQITNSFLVSEGKKSCIADMVT